jgi:pimeloyl-ACP methyl ester carboxylesterase
MEITASDGAAIRFEERGAGDDVLLLIHGHPFDRSMWRPQLEAAAAAGWRAIAPDLRGYGASGGGGDKVTLDMFAEDLAILLDRLEVPDAVVGGLSMGGQIAMEFCRSRPERVRGLLLAATSPRAETEEGKEVRRLTADRLLAEGMEAYAEELLPRMLAPGSIAEGPALAGYVLGMMRSAPAGGAAAALRGRAERPPYEPVLQGLDVPGLVVVGDEDAFTGREDADLMHRLLRGSELLWLEGVGHMPNLEEPNLFNAALVALLHRVSEGKAG